MTTKDRVLSMIKTARAEKMEKFAAVRPFSNKAYEAGFRKAAEAHGIDPDKLIKLASFWGTALTPFRWVGNTIGGAYGAIENAITGEDGGDGFWDRMGRGAKTGWNTADNFQKELPGEVFSSNTVENFASAARSAGNGLVSGIISLPGMAGGLVSGAWNGVTGLGKGLAKGWNEGDGFWSTIGNTLWGGAKGAWNGAGEGYSAGKNWVNTIGPEGYRIENLHDFMDRQEAENKAEYMERNNITPGNGNFWDSAALSGLNMAHDAAEALPATYLLGAAGKMNNGIGATARLMNGDGKAGMLSGGLLAYGVGNGAIEKTKNDFATASRNANSSISGQAAFKPADTIDYSYLAKV